jgi:hypothetical protein
MSEYSYSLPASTGSFLDRDGIPLFTLGSTLFTWECFYLTPTTGLALTFVNMRLTFVVAA